jgi:hypothetical protein
MKTDTLPAEVKTYVDAAVAAAFTKAQAIQAIGANHVWSTNTAGEAVGSIASPTVALTATITPKGTGKLRIIASGSFVNSAAATHSLTPSIGIATGTNPVAAVFTGAPIALISGADAGAFAVVFDVPASVATGYTGQVLTVDLILGADASAALSVPAANQLTMSVQEIF